MDVAPFGSARPGSLRRRREGHLLGGVAAGLGEHLGVSPALVRIGFGLLTLAGGVGILLYILAWLLVPGDAGAPRVPLPSATRGRGDLIDAVALGAIVLGALLLLRAIGLWFPDHLIWPLVLASIGLALVWARVPRPSRPSTASTASTAASAAPGSRGANSVGYLGPLVTTALGAIAGTGRQAMARVAAGVVLVVAGSGAFLAFNGSFTAVRQGLLGALVVFVGLAMIFAPWLLRLSSDLIDERRERIRSQERAEMAAHLHDSVLQTLALIQKRADQPREVVTLARRQERELRSWLNTSPPDVPDISSATISPTTISGTTVGTAMSAVAEQVEERYGVRVELVRVGDCALGSDTSALVQAAGEALVNAAKHAGVDTIDVYVEATGADIEVFVRDRGIGFDLDGVPDDRRGVRESITGRMVRHGGKVIVRTAPGEGTEVELTIPRPVAS